MACSLSRLSLSFSSPNFKPLSGERAREKNTPGAQAASDGAEVLRRLPNQFKTTALFAVQSGLLRERGYRLAALALRQLVSGGGRFWLILIRLSITVALSEGL